jgi:hypothetical protein
MFAGKASCLPKKVVHTLLHLYHILFFKPEKRGRDKRSSLFCPTVSKEKKGFVTLRRVIALFGLADSSQLISCQIIPA